MILPADERLEIIYKLYEEVKTYYLELNSLPISDVNVTTFITFLKKRDNYIELIDKKSKIIEIEKKQFLSDTKIKSFDYNNLLPYNKKIAEKIKELIFQIKEELKKMEEILPSLMSKLNEFKNLQLKEISTINNGKKIINTYNQITICESKFIDQKDNGN